MGMKKEEYLKELTKQLHYAPVRKVVSQEYIDHIEDETEYQISKGMDPDEAESYAVEQMGDPVEVGKQLDEIHRPKNIRIPLSGIIFIVAVCAVFSYFMQKDYYEVLSELIGEPKSAVTILFWGNLIVSVGILVVVSHFPYMKLQKAAGWIAVVFLALPIVQRVSGGIVPESVQTAVMRVLPQINRWNTGYYYWLYVPIYGLLLSWLKGKKHQLALSLGGLILPLLLVFDGEYTQTGVYAWSNFGFWLLAVILFSMFVMAVWANVIPLPKKKTTLAAAGCFVAAKLAYHAFYLYVVCQGKWSTYYTSAGWNRMFLLFSEKRRKAYVALWKEVGGSASLGEDIMYPIRAIRGAKWIGMSEGMRQGLQGTMQGGKMTESSPLFTYLAAGDLGSLIGYVGILPALLMLAALIAFTIWLMKKAWRQTNPAGKLMGAGIGLLYVCQMLYALAELFTLTPGNHQVLLIPLLETLGYMDYGRVVEALFMYGLMVSIYRHQSVSGWG